MRESSPLERAYEGSLQEVEAITAKLENADLSDGKRAKLVFRLSDLESRIIPAQIRRIPLAN